MDSPGVQMQYEPVAPADMPKSREAAPGKKRDDQAEGRETAAASAALTVSFAEILQSKRLDLKAGAEESAKQRTAVKANKLTHHKLVNQDGEMQSLPVNGQTTGAEESAKQGLAVKANKFNHHKLVKKDGEIQSLPVKEQTAGAEESAKQGPAVKANKFNHHKLVKEDGEIQSLPVKEQAAVGKQVRKTVSDVQARATRENVATPAETASKTIQEKPLVTGNRDSVQPVELPKKGALSEAEEAQLKELIQKNGAMPGRKDTTAQMKGFVNGEPLNRPEGIGAVKTMTAREGEVLKNLSGDDETQTPQKLRMGKPGKAQHASALRDVTEGEEKAFQSISSADKMKQEFANQMENAQDKLASAGLSKKQSIQQDAGQENRGVFLARGDHAAPAQDKSVGSPFSVRPQAVMSQVLDGAVEVLRNGSGRMALTLQPPRLGTLDLDVAVKDNRVTMIMLADNQEVKQMLQSGMDDLRNALQDKGFQIDRLEVLVQNRPDNAGSGFWQEAGFAGDDSRGREERKREREAAPAVQGQAERTIRSGENGISIFA
jgi:flagellar hook-length control protein FliK